MPQGMARCFNTTGPCDPERHYMLAAELRAPDLSLLVDRGLYFVLHAARQTGKTTAMRAFAARLRAKGRVALWATLETSQGIEDVSQAEPLWMMAIALAAEDQLEPALRPPAREGWMGREVGGRLLQWLRAWCAALPDRSVILLLDEADVVAGPALVSLLRQLRAGFMDRGPGNFPVSVGLVGMRDLRDYLARSKDGLQVNPGSPFNIKAASLTLRDFDAAEVAELLAQHTQDTGQIFTEEAAAEVYRQTRGQPFLVNALAAIATQDLAPDRGVPITAAIIGAARDRLILSRTTHIDALAERLREPRVARIVASVLLSDQPEAISYRHDDFQYVLDLGLIRQGDEGAEAANPIYQEVLGRELSYDYQESLPRPRWQWRTQAGHLDMPVLIEQFLHWWRDNAAIVEEHAERGYAEAVPHLAFMGFLQKVVNGGGQVHREFAAGRGAIDLLVHYGDRRHVIELKRVPPRHRTLAYVRGQGLEQLQRYLGEVGEREGWLIIFDQRPGRGWDERLWAEDLTLDGRLLHLRGA